MSQTSYFATFKLHFPAIMSAIFSGLFFLATLLFNSGGQTQHTKDKQAELEKRIDLLEKDQVTRREVDLMRQEMKDGFADLRIQIQAYRDEQLKRH